MKRLILALLLISLCWTPAQAAYQYSFDMSGQYGLPEILWSFEVPSLLTVTTTIPASELYSVYTTYPSTIDKVSIISPLTNSPSVRTDFADTYGVIAPGYGQPFDAPGTYLNYNLEHYGTITITETTEPIPEPATMLLLATGLAGLAGLRRRIRK